jgi:carboxyl-terminal processing protease
LPKHLKITLLILSICCSPCLQAKISIEPSYGKELLAEEIYKKITMEHFFQDQAFANHNLALGQALIEQLDSQKIYFTKNEISHFTKKFKSSSSDIEITTSYELVNLYFNRMIEATNFQIKEIKKNNFNFYEKAEIPIDDDLRKWHSSKFELKKTWRKLAKNDVLTSMLADKTEAEAIKLISKRYKNRLRRIAQRNEEDIFSIVMNNLTGLFDPHSSYFSPKSAEDFEMTMSLKLEGIGALLTTEDDYPVIVSVVPGGPADKSGNLNPNDRIVKVKQLQESNPAAVDVVGWRIDEVVQLIRGETGTKLELEIIPAKTEDLSDRKWVSLTREEVKLEEQAAKSKIVEIPHNEGYLKIGIIDLPAFYIDFKAWRDQDPDFRSSSKDVEVILNRFNSNNVDGVIVDLRGNAGGSLYEANKLTGLFLASGATVQVKESNGKISSWGDARAEQVWTKPLAVMVDSYSASASEIFAGAIQDYQRGLIIGHPTFGKGTVQKLGDLSVGQLKLTQSKFYRITGAGMQNKGVEPDIALPATWNLEETGERGLDSALPWDEIKPVSFKKFKIGYDVIAQLKTNHSQRLIENPNLQYILNIKKRYDEQREKKYLSINIKTRTTEKIDRQLWALETENKRRSAVSLEVFKSYDELEEFNKNKEDIDIDIDNDFLLNEGALILSDYIYLSMNLLLSEAA